MTGGKIHTSENPLPIRPNETRKIPVSFLNMEPCPLRYELDPKDGKVSRDGLYTASERKGVHTIRVLCAPDPLINVLVNVQVDE